MVSGRLDPGIGTTTGDCGEHPGQADLLRADPVRRRPPRRTRRTASPSPPAARCRPAGSTAGTRCPARRTGPARARDERNAGEYWFCTRASRPPRISWASRICAGLAFEMPAIRILPASSRSRERADRLRVRHLRVRPVVLVQADRLHAEPLERRLAGRLAGTRATRRGSRTRRPDAGGRPWSRPARRRVAAVAGQRLGDQRLVVARPRRRGGGRRRRCRSSVTPASSAAWMVAIDALAVRPALDRHRHRAEPDRGDLDVTDRALLHGCLSGRSLGSSAGGRGWSGLGLYARRWARGHRPRSASQHPALENTGQPLCWRASSTGSARRFDDVRRSSPTPPSSSGLGLRPFKAAARVRIPLGVRTRSCFQGPVAQLVSAPPCHGGGRGFESRRGRSPGPHGPLVSHVLGDGS